MLEHISIDSMLEDISIDTHFSMDNKPHIMFLLHTQTYFIDTY